MNTPEPESDRERNIRFQKVIDDRFKRGSSRENLDPILIPDYSDGSILSVFVYQLSVQSEKYPEAERCVAWDGKSSSHDANEVVTVLDVQLKVNFENSSKNSKELALAAVEAWHKNWLVNTPENPNHYAKSETWTKEKLDGKVVEFRLSPYEKFRNGRFFVRERRDGTIAVRINEEGVDFSFCLTRPDLEKIKLSHTSGGCFSLSLP